MEGRCSKVILTEASLGRVLHHVKGNDKVKSWAVLTAYRYMNTPAENKEANKKLQSEIRSKNLGFIQMEGHWQECQDRKVNYSDCPKDKLVDSVEISLFVPNLSKVDAHKLGNNYNQDSVLYGGDDTKGNAFLIYNNGRVESVGKFHPDNIQQAYSKMRNSERTFAFQRGKNQKKNMGTMAGSSADNDDKLVKMLPKDILNKTIRNTETGHDIKLATALRKNDNSPVKKAAMSMVAMLKK